MKDAAASMAGDVAEAIEDLVLGSFVLVPSTAAFDIASEVCSGCVDIYGTTM